MAELVEVRARDCACPDSPHEEGDIVFMLPRASLPMGLAVHQIFMTDNGAADLDRIRNAGLALVRYGAVGWNLLDEMGKPVPFDIDALIGDFTLGFPPAQRAEELYTDEVMRPLTQSRNAPSRSGQTTGSTSPRTKSTRKRRASSSPVSSAATPLPTP